METKEVNKRLINAKNTLFKEDVLPHQLEGALKSMLNVKDKTPIEDIRADEIIAKIHYLLGEYELSNDYYRFMLSIKPNTPKYYLGIYKNYVALGDIDNILISLEDYKVSLSDSVKNFDTRLIETLLTYAKTGKKADIWNSYKYMYFDVDAYSKDDYFQLCMAVNREDFVSAMEYAKKLEEYVRSNDKHVEFFTLINLLKMCESIRRKKIKDNIDALYRDLKVAVDNKDTISIYKLLSDLKLFSVKNSKLIVQSIYILIENNFLVESTRFIEEFRFNKGFKEQIKVLRKRINEELFLLNLSDEEFEVYEDAIELGRYYYRTGDLVQAMDAYTWGLYVTEAPIFNYYIGKIFYKQNRLKEAREYLLKYVEVGGSKLDKAYLYLSKVYEKYGNKKMSVHYSRYVDYCNDVMNKTFDFVSPFDSTQDVDSEKVRMQRRDDIGEEYFGEDKLEDLETYVRLIKEGKRHEATMFLEGLKNVENKTRDQKLVLRIIDRNKKLYEQKRV